MAHSIFMQNISDFTLLTQLRTEDNASFELLYKSYSPSIFAFIKQNKGNNEDAEDVFQEAIMVLLQKVRQPDFVLSASLKTYLSAIAKNIWLKRLRDNKIIMAMDECELSDPTETFNIELQPEKTEEEKVRNWMERITAHCQQVLKALFFYQESMDSLMIKMGWKNKHTAANQKYKCIEKVKKEIGKESEN